MGMESFNQDPYSKLDSLSADELATQIDSLNLDQLTYLKTKTKNAMGNPAFQNLDMPESEEEQKATLAKGPITVDGKTLDELTRINAMVSDAMNKSGNLEM